MEDAAVVGGGVFAGLLGDDVAGAGAEFEGAAEADVDGVPGGLHALHQVGALARVGVVDAGREGEGVAGARSSGSYGVAAVVCHAPALEYIPSLPVLGQLLAVEGRLRTEELLRYRGLLGGPPDRKAHHLLYEGRVQIHRIASRG